MEIVVSNKNYKELNRIRIGMIESYLDTKVDYSSYERMGTDTQLVTIELDEELNGNEKRAITKIIEKLDYCCKFLYIGYEMPIKQLKSMNHRYHKIMNYKDVYFYNPNDLNEELEEFAHEFIKHFKHNFRHIKLNDEEVTATLGLEKLGLLPCKIHNSNSRLYLEIDGEKHHMSYKEMGKFIKNKMRDSNLESHYKIESNMDRINILRLMKGLSPLSPYFPTESTNYHTFRLTMAFAKLCKEKNLPMFNCKDIVSFSQDILGFEYYTLNNVINLKEVYESLVIKDYKEHDFEYLENALAFSVYLSGFGIKNFIISKRTLQRYIVCYVYSSLLDPYVNIDDMKKRIIDSYYFNKDFTENKKFKHMSIQELLSCVKVRDYLIFDKHNFHHISPHDHEPLPLWYYEIKGYQKHSIYNIGNIIKGIFKRVPIFDRSDLELREVHILLDNGKVVVHGVTVAEDMFFSNQDRALRHIHKIWRKGHFLNSMGLMYYLETGNFTKQTIRSPEWFTLKNSNERDFFKFLKFNDL